MNYRLALTNGLRSLLPRSVKQGLKKCLGLPLARIHNDWSIVEPIGRTEDVHIVIDVGARNGWFSQCWLDWNPQARIHQFEPEPIAAKKLAAKAESSEQITFNAVGLGNKEENLPFYYLTESTVSSSFLQPNEQAWNELRFQHGDIDVSSLPIMRLDDYCAQQEIQAVRLIKIDVQGFELKALQGSLETLAKTDYVLVESAIKPLYHDAASFTQVHEFMAAQGFHLQTMRAWHRGNHVLMETDMLFRHNRLAGPVDESIDRIYNQV
ncbi:MAG: FkbM family methyltransferase [Arenicella sp.]